MNAETAQIVQLARMANAIIRDGKNPKHYKKHVVFTCCERIEFMAGINNELICVADDPTDWCQKLRAQGVIGVWLIHQNYDDADPRFTGLEGGNGEWAIATLKPDGTSQLWISEWGSGERKPIVRYLLVSHVETPPLESIDLDDVVKRFQKALEEIIEFSSRQKGLDNFTRCFKDALNLILKGSDRRDALLDACGAAWVFGGMGSWNDLGFEGADHETYERVSRDLHNAITEAQVAAANG